MQCRPAKIFGIKTIADFAGSVHPRKPQMIAHLGTIQSGQMAKQAA